jgi:hypothetical protein
VVEHPDWFISLPYSPFPSYSCNGPDVADDGRVEIKIEDHYFDRSDAAVVFRRLDRWSGDARYVYHGNDGTSFPWNDTAQLNYLKPEVREAVIQTILHVARQFPIIRFDAAMTLTKRHYQRLWFPEPGTGGAIPSRAEHGMTKAEFDAAMPQEFWREVVDRVAAEAPNTLLLAEAFWLMEGYFVRTLGMHRVYNSAFMNMLRDEENANYRSVIKNTLAFDPEVLKRYVNFMNNPDERTAVDQFGKGDKYFGVCTMMATLPGLPMFGHGQIEGYTERYGMEYRRAYHDEQPDPWLVARHEREISPLLHRRRLFAEVANFLLYDFFTDQGHVNEDVFAYSNREGQDRALVVFNNRYASTRGWIRLSCAYAEKSPAGKHMNQKTLGEAFGLSRDAALFIAYRDAFSGLEYLHRARDLAERGLNLELHAYQTHVFLDWCDLHEDAAHPWGELCGVLGGRGVASLDDALRDLRLRPVHQALRAVVTPELAEALAECSGMKGGTSRSARVASLRETLLHRTRIVLVEIDRYLANSGRHPSASREALDALINRIETALRIPAISKSGVVAWPDEAREVLPLGESSHPEALLVWTSVLAWAVMEAIGRVQDHRHPETAAVKLFDTLRLRHPIAEALNAAGASGEEQWRGAARVRALLAHSSHPNAPYSWIQDPDVAWLMGVHHHEGSAYVVKEHFERVLWWMALPALLEIAGAQEPDLERLEAIRDQISERIQAMASGGYKMEEMEETSLLDEARDPQSRLQKKS